MFINQNDHNEKFVAKQFIEMFYCRSAIQLFPIDMPCPGQWNNKYNCKNYNHRTQGMVHDTVGMGCWWSNSDSIAGCPSQ
jgi:hypothetical protein